MAEFLKSGVITNLDASPMVVNSAGQGGATRLHVIDSAVTVVTAAVSSTYQLVRLRSNAVVKHLYIKLDATAVEFDADIGCYYSTAVGDGTLPTYASLAPPTQVNGTTGSQLFGAAVVLDADVTFVDHAAGLSAATLDKELWSACGLTTDPGGFFDIVLTSTGAPSGTPTIYTEVWFAAT